MTQNSYTVDEWISYFNYETQKLLDAIKSYYLSRGILTKNETDKLTLKLWDAQFDKYWEFKIFSKKYFEEKQLAHSLGNISQHIDFLSHGVCRLLIVLSVDGL